MPPEPVPLPITVPGGRPPRSYRGLIITIVVIFVVLLVSACAVAAPRVGSFVTEMLDYGQMRLATGTTGAWWSGDGQWVFSQSSDAKGVSAITAVRVSDSTTRTLEGYWLLAIEPTGSRIRVIADPMFAPLELIGSSADPSATIAAADAAFVAPGSLSDLPGTGTLAWDPSAGGDPAVQEWAVDAPADGVSAAFFTSATRGVNPSRITLTRASRTLTVDSTSTMQPIGWSRSLRYYAAIDLAVLERLFETDLDEEYSPSSRLVVVRMWDLETMSEVASAVVDPAIQTKVVWSPSEEALYWTDRGSDEEEINVVRVLRPLGRPEAVAFSPRDASTAPMVVGADARGVLVRLLTSGSDETTSSESSGANFRRRHLGIGAGSKVTDRGSDSVPAIFTEVGPLGVLWWQPSLPAGDGPTAISASGITVWLSDTLDTTPSVIHRGGVPDSTTTY